MRLDAPDELTERQRGEMAYHREHAKRNRELLRKPVGWDCLDRPARRWWNAYWAMYARLIRLELAGRRVLVVGCGFGHDALRLARLGAVVHAFDLSRESLSVARALAAREGLAVAFAHMPAERLAYRDGQFECVVATDILHHVDVARAMAELRRVSRPGAWFVMNEVYSHSWTDSIRRSALVERTLYPRMQRFIYGPQQPYITPGERKLTERDVAAITGSLQPHWQADYFNCFVTRLVPSGYTQCAKIDRLVLRALGPLAGLLGGRLVVAGRLAHEDGSHGVRPAGGNARRMAEAGHVEPAPGNAQLRPSPRPVPLGSTPRPKPSPPLDLRTRVCFALSRKLMRPPVEHTVDAQAYAAWRCRDLARGWADFDDAYVTDKDVLDFGCGDGPLTLFLAQEKRPRRIVGVDIDAAAMVRAQAALAETQRGGNAEVEFLLGSPDRIPAADASFDTLLAFDCLEHVMAPAVAVREWHRVLRPGGRCLIRWYPYRGPWGPHMEALVPIPWAHVLFGERAMLRTAALVYDLPAFAPRHWDLDEQGRKKPNKWPAWTTFEEQGYINKLSITHFRDIAKVAGFRVARHERRSFSGSLPRRTLARLLMHMPLVGEYFTSHVIIELQRPNIGDRSSGKDK